MSISYNGIGQQVVTFPQDGCVEGMVCKLNADGIPSTASAIRTKASSNS